MKVVLLKLFYSSPPLRARLSVVKLFKLVRQNYLSDFNIYWHAPLLKLQKRCVQLVLHANKNEKGRAKLV